MDEVLAMISGTATSFYHQDGLGSAVRLTDASGNVVESYTYDVYGGATVTDGQGNLLSNGSAMGNRFLFTGREWLASVNLYDYRYRLYSQDLGRWISRDPLEEEGGINLYAYVDNDPVNLVDPDGENPIAGAVEGGEIGSAFGPGGTIIGAGLGAIAGGIIGAKIYDWWHNHPGPGTSCPTKGWDHESPNPDKTNRRGDHKNRPDGKRDRGPKPPAPKPGPAPTPYNPNSNGDPYNNPPKDGGPARPWPW